MYLTNFKPNEEEANEILEAENAAKIAAIEAIENDKELRKEFDLEMLEENLYL